MKKEKLEFEEGELLNLLDILKDGDVRAKDLMIKVYDIKSKKEGWISFEQIINNFASLIK